MSITILALDPDKINTVLCSFAYVTRARALRAVGAALPLRAARNTTRRPKT
jgi:hypothetical protein